MSLWDSLRESPLREVGKLSKHISLILHSILYLLFMVCTTSKQFGVFVTLLY